MTKAELRVELEDAYREIEHMHREIQQLRKLIGPFEFVLDRGNYMELVQLFHPLDMQRVIAMVEKYEAMPVRSPAASTQRDAGTAQQDRQDVAALPDLPRAAAVGVS